MREQRACVYDPLLGRQPGRWLIGGEEEMLLRSLFEAGARGVWVADAIVEHVVSAERQTLGHLRRYHAGMAITNARIRAANGHREAPLPSAIADAACKELRYRRARLREPDRMWIPALIAAAIAYGKLVYRFGLLFGARGRRSGDVQPNNDRPLR
jgi:hypothetical protein